MTENSNTDRKKESLTTHIAVNASYSVFGVGAQKSIRYIVAFVLTNMLGASLYGQYSLGMSITDIAKIFIILGMNYGAIRYISYYLAKDDIAAVKGALKFFLLTVGGLSLVISAGFYFLAPTIANDVYQKPQITQVLQILAFALPPMSLIFLMSAIFRGFQQIKYSVLLSDLILPLLSGLFFSAAWWFGESLITVMYLVVAINISGVILASYFLLKIFPQIVDKGVLAVSNNKEIFLYSLPLFMSVFLNIFLNRTDVLMLGYFGSTADVGIYSLAAKLSQVVFIISASVYGIFAPVVSELFAKDDRSKLKKIFSQSTRYSAIVTVPIFGALILSHETILSVFGKEFTEGAEVLLILGLAFLINSILGFAGQMISMSGRSKLVLMNSVGGASLNILLNWFFIPKWGMAGAAWATMIATIAVNAARVTEVLYFEKMHAFSLKLLKPILLGGFVLFSIMQIELSSIPDVWAGLTKTVIFCFTYALIGYFLIITDDDKQILNGLLQKFKRRKV
ncbi:MAG: flippase [Candidatus Marinimicrobia bacterium]|nr:flippase [Candidatus Neomarinimicrobiota bacterium]